MKLLMQMFEELVPELEIRIVEKAKIKFEGEETKEWMAFLIREKKAEKEVT